MLSIEIALPSGEILHPYGEHPSGMLTYQPGGFMSAQLSVANPARFASEDLTKASTDEAAAAWHNSISYWGTFSLRPDRQIIVHHVEGSAFPNWIGTDQARNFRFNNSGHLVLEAESAGTVYTLTWQRKSS